MTKIEHFLTGRYINSYNLRKKFPGEKWARNIARLEAKGRIRRICRERLQAIAAAGNEAAAAALSAHPRAGTFWTA